MDFANDFSQAGEAYRRGMVRVLNDDLIKSTRGMSMLAEWGYKVGGDLWKLIPAFIRRPRLGDHPGRNLIPIATLLFWFVASLLLLRRSVKRMRVDV